MAKVKFFAISTDPLTEEEEKTLKSAFSPAGWWHWLPNFWLVHDVAGTHTTVSLRDKLFDINSKIRAIIVEINPSGWAALIKKDAAGNDMAEWLHKNLQSQQDD